MSNRLFSWSLSSVRGGFGATLLALALVGALGGAPAAAELAILEDGEVLKVTDWEVGAERARLTLASGGVLTVSSLRIERIIADEIVRGPASEELPVKLGLRFRQEHRRPGTSYGELIYETARRHGVNPEVVTAVIRVESAFDPRAVSRAGARGLMQLMPATAARFDVRTDELLTPARNLHAGVRYLAWLMDRFEDDPVRVFAAYNAGEGAVERYGGVPPYRETRGYVEKVMALLDDSPDLEPVAAAG